MATDRTGRRAGTKAFASEKGGDPAMRSQRLDRWLYFARISKSRTLAQKLCQAGHVRINRDKVRSGAKAVRPGDVLTLSLPSRVRVLKIAALGDRRGPAVEAQTLYEDMTPPSPQLFPPRR